MNNSDADWSRHAQGLAFIFVISLLIPGQPARAEKEYWPSEQWKCSRLIEVTGQPDKENPVAVFTFQDGGHLAKGGKDIIILDQDRKKIPLQVIWCEPAGETTIIFPAKSIGGRFAVYYGNLFATEPTLSSWQPKHSLVLKTMETGGEPPADFKEMKNLMRRSKNVYRVGFVENIWHGLNPYGPDDNYLSVYEGYLRIDREGVYQIATASDDASFLLIDGNLVAEWPGDHSVDGGLRGEHSGTVKLSAGIHEIIYYHHETTGAQFMMAAWKTPGAKDLEIIPSSSFLHPARTREIGYARSNQSLAADFTAEQVDEIVYGQTQYTRIDFVNKSYDLSKHEIHCDWDFGDGTSSSEKSPPHVYVGLKDYLVTLKAETPGERDTFKFTVRINEPVNSLTVEDKKSLNDYAQIIAGYEHSKPGKEELLAYIKLLENLDDKRPLIPVCEAYLGVSQSQSPHFNPPPQGGRKQVGVYPGKHEEIAGMPPSHIMWLLAEAYEGASPEKAVALYSKIAKLEKNGDLVFKADKSRAEIYLHKLRDYDRSREIYESLVKRFSPLSEKGKLARVGIGDIYKEQDEYDKAKEVYAKIEEETTRNMSPEEANLRRGAYASKAQSYLMQGQLDAALNQLIEWEINFPMSKVTGELTLLYCQYYLRRGDYGRVIGELTSLLKLNPQTPYLDEAKDLIDKAQKGVRS